MFTRTRRHLPTGRELGKGHPGRDHTAISPKQVGPRDSDVALCTTTGPRWMWGFGYRRHPGSEDSFARPLSAQQELGHGPTYLAIRGRPPRSQPRLPGESAPQRRNSQSSAEPWCELRKEPSKIERGDSVGQSATIESEGRVMAPPPSLRRPRNPSAKIPGSNQRLNSDEGRVRPGSYPELPASPASLGEVPCLH